ncbi:putative amino acid permease YhdG [Clostridium coskatii]|uniref:Amino acid permease YhdG n=2 Tax=Clostridium coskatii TaxID=1705578 RepID=A0A166TFI3_9CLOT|nr:putative amino acid permease YhdG [Clostridium coskatii]OBR94404.1 putative amino acid permease YhdG [Clostridium coskatii]
MNFIKKRSENDFRNSSKSYGYFMGLFRKRNVNNLENSVEANGLKRKLNAIDIAALGLGAVIGTGIFVVTGQGAHMAGPAVVISYLIAAITSTLCALTYAELATMFPVSGSTYSYCYVAFGEIIAWIVGWNLILEYLVSAAIVASGWSSVFVGILKLYNIYLPDSITKSLLSGGIIDLPSVLLIIFITYVLYKGVSESSKINNITVIIKIAVIVIFIALGVPHINVKNYHPFAPFGLKGIMTASSVIFFAYIGFDTVSTSAEESINPKRDVPIGLMICMTVIVILYLAISLVLTGIVPFMKIDVNNALPFSLAQIGINWGSVLVSVGAVVGMVSTLLVTLYGQIRIFMTMSRDGLIPSAFSKITSRNGIPGICTILTGIITGILSGFLPFNILMDLCNIGTLSAFVMVSIGVIILRKTMPNAERKFRCPGVPFTPILTVAFCLYLMAGLQPLTWMRFLIWTIVGLAIYFLYGIKHSTLNY